MDAPASRSDSQIPATKLLNNPLQLTEPRTMQLKKPFWGKSVIFGYGWRERRIGSKRNGGHGCGQHHGASGVMTSSDALSGKQRRKEDVQHRGQQQQ